MSKNILVYGHVQGGKTQKIIEIISESKSKSKSESTKKTVLIIQNSLLVLDQYCQRLSSSNISFQILDKNTLFNSQVLLIMNNSHRLQHFSKLNLSPNDFILILDESDMILDNILKGKKESSGPFFRSPDFSSWYNTGVLPYLDLKLWEKLTGQAFQWSAFANALNIIVDKPIGSESALQKTVKKSAEKLMDYQVIRILKSQVVREQSGTLKKSGKLVVR